MEYEQERIATLHRFGDIHGGGNPVDVVSLADTSLVLPMTERELGTDVTASILSTLETLDLDHVWVPVRSAGCSIESFREWIESFEIDATLLWCNGPAMRELLDAHALKNGFGKGRDVWLALGAASTSSEYVVLHDADTKNYSSEVIRSLRAALLDRYSFSKGYYARIEDGQMYGRLVRLLIDPLVKSLQSIHSEPVLDYLEAFRYPLAGEMAMESTLAKQVEPPISWGLEMGVLGTAFEHAGFEGSVQVDLGTHEHDHRPVSGDSGLETMSEEVVGTLFSLVSEYDIDPCPDRLLEEYRRTAIRLVGAYEADARYNGLSFDLDGELHQVETYAETIRVAEPPQRLPAWIDSPIDPAAVIDAGTSTEG